jgi:hypothetical protein
MGMHGFQTNRHITNLLKRLVVICGALILVAIACVLFVGCLLAHPVQTRIGNPPADLQAESVTFPNDSKCKCPRLVVPSTESYGAILLLPGIRANRLSMVDRARFLRGAGYSVMLIDFQATGETEGDHITFGWKESRDVIAAANLIRRIDPASRVAIIGGSLGGVAALLATPPPLVLEAVYPTIEIATRNRMENHLGSFGRMLTPVLLNQFQWRLRVSALQLRPPSIISPMSTVRCSS